MDPMFRKATLCADNLAATTQAAPATHRIYIYTKLSCSLKQRGADGEITTTPGRRKYN